MSGSSLRRARPRKYRIPRGFAATPLPPFERVLALGVRRDGLRFAEAALVALLAHGLVVVLAIFGKGTPLPVAPPKKREIVVTAAPPPPPPPKPEVPKPPPPPEPPKSRPTRVARAAPPQPAPKQAGKVISAAADPNAPMDMTGFSMPVGEGKYEGGPVSAKPPPPAPTPVAEAPRPRVAAVAPGPSLAKPPGPARRNWACSWPDDEQDSDLRDAKVTIRVAVSIDGAPDRVDVIESPKPSFAEAARRCALAETYRPALNDTGNRMPALTAPFNVHFVR